MLALHGLTRGEICLEQITNKNKIQLDKFKKKQNPPGLFFCQNSPGMMLVCTRNESKVQQLKVCFTFGTQ